MHLSCVEGGRPLLSMSSLTSPADVESQRFRVSTLSTPDYDGTRFSPVQHHWKRSFQGHRFDSALIYWSLSMLATKDNF
ncbi:hypothetical protein Tco_0847696 [Tanacetum coccineum]